MGSSATGAIGAVPLEDGRCLFRVWAPNAAAVHLCLIDEPQQQVEMMRDERGYFQVLVDDVGPGARYFIRLDAGADRPDPASRFQPEGPRGPSTVVDSHFDWTDDRWAGVPLEDCVFYEIHVGTFTEEGTFDAAAAHLDGLRDLGITMIEVMPVAQFPGTRNWGYDGAAPFAVQHSYGGPDGLRRFVDACHRRGMGVALDVVYNHLGPDGNYLRDFGPYFSDKYHTPWGEAINFDDRGSDEVRRYFIANALMWVREYHIDALRLDAVHAIFDQSAYPFLQELADEIHGMALRLNRRVHVIAESDLNDPKLVRAPEIGGWGMDGHWSDDFHHALHALMTGERDGYYEDFGRVGDLARAMQNGYAYDGRHSRYRGRRHGVPADDVPSERFVVCAQNHDQVGNRMRGDRLSTMTDLDGLKLVAGTVILAPFLPLLFMGDEYGETAPFQYFVSHESDDLIEAVRRGRREEFSAFGWEADVPDPQDEATFERSRLNRGLAGEPRGQALRRWYKRLIEIRRTVPAVRAPRRNQEVTCDEARRTMTIRRWTEDDEILLLLNFGAERAEWRAPAGEWRVVLDSADEEWNGQGASGRRAAAPRRGMHDAVRLHRRGLLLLRRRDL